MGDMSTATQRATRTTETGINSYRMIRLPQPVCALVVAMTSVSVVKIPLDL